MSKLTQSKSDFIRIITEGLKIETPFSIHFLQEQHFKQLSYGMIYDIRNIFKTIDYPEVSPFDIHQLSDIF